MSPNFTIHHINGTDEGNATDVDNLIVLCNRCHFRVHHDENAKELLDKRLERRKSGYYEQDHKWRGMRERL